MSRDTFREALGSKLGQVITPELAAWLEANAFDHFDLSHEPAKFGQQQYDGLTFQVERFRDIQQEIAPLHEAHYAETEGHRKDIPLDLDYPGYVAAERAGCLIQFTARDAAGKLVGNCRMKLYISMHTQTLHAREDTIFMLPEQRKGFNSVRLWQFMENSLAAIGVRGIYTDSKVLFDEDGNVKRDVGRFNKYLGYELVTHGFYKPLGG